MQDIQLPAESYDAVLLIDALEHLDDPAGALEAAGRLLRPQGRVLVVAANARSAAATVFRGRHWHGYDFPRHRNIFDAETLRRLAESAGLQVSSLRSASAPYAWVGSVRNALDDWGAPPWLSRRFGRSSLPALGFAALVEALEQLRGKGGLVIATLRRARAG
jgi:SAM-dependent methyltransferase